MKQMIIIGAGAAGMMTAIHASSNYIVTIIEKNEKPGKKLFITGKGRCNVTNDSDPDTFLGNVITNPKFLYSAIYSYDQSRVMDDFESWGVKLKTERGNRVFPVSDHSSDIIKALTEQIDRLGVRIIYNTTVKDIMVNDENVPSVTGVKLSNGRTLQADVVVLASGGMAYPQTGSTGDGYDILKAKGIEIVNPRPSLVPLETEESEVADMMGLSLKNTGIKVIAPKEHYTFLKKDKILYSDFGEMLFTHFGVSGPMCLSASSYISSFIYGKGHGLKPHLILDIDLKPALSEEDLDKRIQRDFNEFKNKDFQNSLDKLLPRLLIPVIVSRSGIRADKKVHDITAEERKKLVSVLKSYKLTITGLRGFKEAIITGGGVSVKEIDPYTMELKKIKGLRVAGEIIDCDALTGGFNLQIAWSTAYLAAT